MQVSLILFVAGICLIYLIFRNNGWSGELNFDPTWQHLTNIQRLFIWVGFLTSAYGCGGIIGNIFRSSKEP
jgi:hypothetical protein